MGILLFVHRRIETTVYNTRKNKGLNHDFKNSKKSWNIRFGNAGGHVDGLYNADGPNDGILRTISRAGCVLK